MVHLGSSTSNNTYYQNVFSSDYDYYLLLYKEISNTSTGSKQLLLRLLSSGTSQRTDSNYGSGYGANALSQSHNQTQLYIWSDDFRDNGGSGFIYISNPYNSSKRTGFNGQIAGAQGTSNYYPVGVSGIYRSTNQNTGLRVYGGGISTIVTSIYGIKE